MTRPVIFEHIPKTGGMSLRGVLQKVYGKSAVFSILFDDLQKSLSYFKDLSDEQQSQYKVIAGHGAGMFVPLVDRPFRVTILREPVSMFISQFFYLKNHTQSQFYKIVSKMSSLEEYIPYAQENGQNNMMTRFLSGSFDFFLDPGIPVPVLGDPGDEQLTKAKTALAQHDAVLDLKNFDAGIFALSRMLEWTDGIPWYFPQNRTRKKPAFVPSAALRKKLENVLSFDLELYDYFLQNNLDIARKTDQSSGAYKLFRYRQWLFNRMKRLLK